MFAISIFIVALLQDKSTFTYQFLILSLNKFVFTCLLMNLTRNVVSVYSK